MDRRPESTTSVSSFSTADSGVGGVNTFASSASQTAPDEGAQRVVQPSGAGPGAAAATLLNVTDVVAVQESQDNQGVIELNPRETINFRSDGEHITASIGGDLDIQLGKVQQETFRELLLAIERCWTCFTNRRCVVNNPCMCFSNCRDCAQVMQRCSLCGSRIDHAIPVIFQYTVYIG